MIFPFIRKASPPAPGSPPGPAGTPAPAAGSFAPPAPPPRRQRTTAAIFPIHQVTDGACELTDRTWVGLLGVEGVLFKWLSVPEQDQIVARYQGFLHSLRSSIQIVALTDPVQLGEEITYVTQLVAAQTQPALATLGQSVAQQLAQTTAQLERIIFIVAVPGSTRDQALQNAEAVARGLAMVHADLQPRILDQNAIADVWARVDQVVLPASLDTYPWADTPRSPTAPPPPGKKAVAS